MNLHDALPRIFMPLVAAVRQNAERAAMNGEAEHIHRLRVDMARLRNAIELFEAWLPRVTARRLRQELRWLRHTLAPARAWAGFIDGHCRDLAAQRTKHAERAAVLTLAATQVLRRETTKAQKRLARRRAQALLTRLTTFIDVELPRWLDAVPPSHARPIDFTPAVSDIADQAVHHAERRLRRRARHLRHLDAHALHRVRLAAKRLRYTVELFRALEPTLAVYELGTLRGVQEVLGLIQDETVAQQLLAQLAENPNVKAVAERNIARSEKTIRAARKKLRARWRDYADSIAIAEA
ncbi:MAG: CHAD domain-containing protein [Nevskia sp.]|jgi:CHAD domain-containing protein|nr:CHAD domain-containing protein [Nevskia sp.]